MRLRDTFENQQAPEYEATEQTEIKVVHLVTPLFFSTRAYLLIFTYRYSIRWKKKMPFLGKITNNIQ